MLVCLGATAAQAILGRDFRVTRQRGEVVGGALDVPVVATMHPSSVLRAGDDRDDAYAGLVEDLQVVAGLL